MYLNDSARKLILALAATALTVSLSIARADEYADVARLAKAKQFPEALSKADQFLSSKPRDPQMRFIKGVVQSEMGKMSEATSTFSRLTEDFPELPEPYNNLAVIYANNGQFDKARSALEMAIRTNPSYSTAHENLGDIYAKLASQSYAKALQLDTSNAAVPSKLGLIRELFSTTGGVKPAAPTPVATIPTPAANPVVAPIQPKQPTAIVASPAGTGQPSVAPASVTNAMSSRDIDTAVNTWAKAWSNRDMKGYLGSYAKDFTPNSKQSHDAWQEERKARIMGKSFISVKLSSVNVSMSLNGSAATVKFKQDYKADSLATSSRKTLEMVKSGDRWLITKEIAG
jgi:tetratricopeptide (TPR) repeat protein